jgi:phenylalanyl-tRNA synthetase beta chain
VKISFNWIRELVDLPAGAGADDVASRLTLAGLEVESVERRGREVRGVRVAEVRAVRPHPGAEKLRIVRVSVGSGPEEEIVCGAPNVPAAGGRVAWAPPDAALPGGVKMGRREIRGFDSPGMICSERELGIGDGVDGILILSTEVPLGADLASVLGIADDVLEVNVTPNRADALSHAGIAREVAALFGVRWRFPTIDAAVMNAAVLTDAPREGPVTVEIRDGEACPRYLATVMRDLRVGPSPLSIRMRLAACGVRAISNLVDVTNYVMLETGHPLHAFDFDRVQGGVVVRRAHAGEALRTLDGVDRKLESSDIVIADAHEALALAGVMGGATTEVTTRTANILLEAATFDPRAVRRTAKRLGLHSEASHRFERGVDPNGVAVAGGRAAAYMARFAGGRIAQAPVDRYVAPLQPRQVTVTADGLYRVAGFQIPSELAAKKLRDIEISVIARGHDLVATVPTFRQDIAIEEDLIEEIMRLVGFDQVPARLPAGGRAPAPSPERFADRCRDVLSALGLHEISSWAFVSRAALAALGDDVIGQAIAVKNPISADYEVMRTSLLPGLAAAARRNIAHGVTDLGLFEVGPVIRRAAADVHHEQLNFAAGLLSGKLRGWMKPGEPVDFFDLKLVVTELLDSLGARDLIFERPAGGSSLFHPGICAVIRQAGAPVGGNPTAVCGELHPAVARRLGIEARGFYFELHLDPMESRERVIRVTSPPRFPAVSRDLSFWIDHSVTADAQAAALRTAGETLLRQIAVLEDFRDARFVAPGKKGMLWTLTYRADERTLTDAEVDAAHTRAVAALGRAFPIEIR